MTTNQHILARRAAIMPRGVSQAHSLIVDHANNAELWDIEGRRYLDFVGGIAVVNTGHCHPKVVEAIQQQAAKFTHTCFQVAAYEPYITLAERLCALAPGNFAKKAFFMSTGAEAVENALKVARSATGRSAVIAFNGAFHGRTMFGLALTGKVEPYKVGFGPFPAEVFHAPFPNAMHGISEDDAIQGIKAIFKNDVEAKRVAAIFIEPVQGEGGYYVAPASFLKKLRALCDEHGILLVADEIQTGMGRTGKYFAIEHAGIHADIITMAKGLGGGTTISAIIGKAEIMDAPIPGGLGGTYAGNPLACAAALAVLDIMQEEKINDRSLAMGETMRQRLTAMKKHCPWIAEVRGLGAMTSVEFAKNGDAHRPSPEVANALKAKAFERGLLLLNCGVYGNVLRLMPPLTTPDAQLHEALDIIEICLTEISATF
jgi:4-aminobutyrate aminotransferase/(S)-3-amino-2-methylpropionate transaminase